MYSLSFNNLSILESECSELFECSVLVYINVFFVSLKIIFGKNSGP